MDDDLPKFQRVQQAFANRIKSPLHTEGPTDINARHMAIYRDLFFKNIMGFLNGGFPVLAEIIGEQRWQEIGRDFFIRHQNKSPQFLEISEEFLFFLQHEYQPMPADPVYIYELAHYEWLELYIDVKQERDEAPFNIHGDVLFEVPLLSPAVEGFLYQYPVHQISKNNPNPNPQETALIVYRKRNDKVGFVETTPFTLKLLALLKEESVSSEHIKEKGVKIQSMKNKRAGRDILNVLLRQNNLQGHQAAFDGGIETLKQWYDLGIIWGTLPLHVE